MFWENFVLLCNNQKESPTFVCTKLGFSATMATKWKNGAVPRHPTLMRIANYFGVSVDYLMGKEDNRPQEPKQSLTQLDAERVHMIPLFENVSAGFGALAVSDIVDYVPLYFSNYIEAKETICIRVRGDSMSPKIEDGDIVQVRKQDSVESGSVAVVLVDGDEGLIKIALHGSGWLELRSINPLYKPMRFNGADTERVRIVGVVTKIIKNVSGQVHEPARNDSKKVLHAMLDQMDEDQLREINNYIEFIANKKK